MVFRGTTAFHCPGQQLEDEVTDLDAPVARFKAQRFFVVVVVVIHLKILKNKAFARSLLH